MTDPRIAAPQWSWLDYALGVAKGEIGPGDYDKAIAEIARLRRIEEAAREAIAAIDADLHREGTPEDWWQREASLAALRAALEEKP